MGNETLLFITTGVSKFLYRNVSTGVEFDGCLSSRLNGLYLLAEHRRHQILPGLVRDGDIGFQGIVVLVTGEVQFHNFVVHNVVE